ncbi:MAG: YqgE/AlgH family protein [Nitrospira sp.]|nr:YqgE/AlgH family protein [Nitrospira sp.]
MRRGAVGLLALIGFGYAAGATAAAPVGAAVATRPVAAKDAPAAGMLLVARRDLPDPNFHESVVLLTAHGAGGSAGLIVNRRTRLRLSDAMPELANVEKVEHPLFFGGPVARAQIVMLMRRERPAEQIERVTDDIFFSADRDVLESVLARKKPASELRLYLGHAGWAPGQLARELARGDWHVMKANAELVFSDDEATLWERLIRSLDPPGLLVRLDRTACGTPACPMRADSGAPPQEDKP